MDKKGAKIIHDEFNNKVSVFGKFSMTKIRKASKKLDPKKNWQFNYKNKPLRRGCDYTLNQG